MKKALAMILLFPFCSVWASTANFFGDIERIRTWAGGSDTYGIWVEFEQNPTACPNGFFMLHQQDNKELVYSFLLASSFAGRRVGIQALTHEMSGGKCRVNYVMHG